MSARPVLLRLAPTGCLLALALLIAAAPAAVAHEAGPASKEASYEPAPEPSLVAPSVVAAEGGQALWRSGFEGGLLDGWRGIQQDATPAYAARTDTEAPREGERSARFELRPGDALSSDGTARQQIWDAKTPDGSLLRFTEGQDLYFGFSLRLRDDYPMDPGKWQVLASWYSGGTGQGPLKLSTAFESDQFRLEGPNGNTVYWRGPVVKGAWLDFVVRVKFSPDPAVGFIEVWYKSPQDGLVGLVKQTMTNGTQRQHFATMESGASYSYLKAGLYRDRSFTTPSVAWFDAWRIARSLEGAAVR